MRSSLSSGIITDSMLESREAFEAGCRAARHVEGDRTGDWATVLGGYPLRVIRGDESLTPHLQRDGFWESWLSLALARHIKPRMRCIDVGANVGYFTLLMADRIGPDGRVIAIEPQEKCQEFLLDSVGRNKTGWVSLYRGAASNRTGRSTLFLYGSLVGSASFTQAKGYTPTGQRRVPHARIDDLIRHTKVDVIKVDAEGAEPLVWEGMTETLRRSSSALVTVEVAVERDYDLGAFLHRIESDGFPLKVIEEDGTPREWSLDKIVEHGAELPTLWLQRE